jgi:4-hydroxy-2-oxovalerate aldolase
MLNPNLQILECTLRDGSYVIDFQFTARDTAVIAAALENVGFRLIEIGHGVGLNASKVGKGLAAASDEEYMQAAANTLNRAQWGMFFIPGIGRHEDIEMAARYGMDFIRIGTDATEVPQSKEYIEHAKNLGLYVSANLMKSYVLSPKKLAKQAKISETFGSDLICLVDSAGSMLPDDVKSYFAAMQDVLTIPIGFHSHDNLALGMANVLAAINCGAQSVDSTMQGMGRGGGNPVTEVLITVLKKCGIDLEINLNRLMDISEHLIKPLLRDKGWNPIDITSGYAGFHSSYLGTILKYADLYHVDPRDLIVSVCEADRVYAPEEVVEEMARQLQNKQPVKTRTHIVALPRFAFPGSKKGEPVDITLAAAVQQVAHDVRATAIKGGKHSVLNIVAALEPIGETTVSRFVQEEFDYVIGSVEVDNHDHLQIVVDAVDGNVDVLLVDSDMKPYLTDSLANVADKLAKTSRVLGYKDNDVWVRSVLQSVDSMLGGLEGQHFTVCGTDSLALRFVLYLIDEGVQVTLTGEEHEQIEAYAKALMQIASSQVSPRVEIDPVRAVKSAEVLVRFDRKPPLISRQMVEALAPNGIVFDAGIGCVSGEAIDYCNKFDIMVVRPDMRATLAAELASLLGAKRIVKEIMGRGELSGVPVVAGGLVGRYGEVVLDSMSNPAKIVGVANGRGMVIYEKRPEFAKNLSIVENEILRKKVF